MTDHLPHDLSLHDEAPHHSRLPRPPIGRFSRLIAACSILWAASLGAPSIGLGQSAATRPVAAAAPATATTAQPTTVLPPTVLPPTVLTAALAWRKAVRRTPKLVSLFSDKESNAAADLDKSLKTRLRVLGDKTFSNREWRNYWASQAETATALIAAVTQVKTPAAAAWSRDLKAWIKLAGDKQKNQDSYLDAIERERDALGERLEASLDPAGDRKPAATDTNAKLALGEEPNPYIKRKLRIAELRRGIDLQTTKRGVAETDLKLIKAQLESEKILHKALLKDVALARRESKIASDAQATAASAPWADVWQTLAQRASPKVFALDKEALHEAARERAREVEAGLTASQIKFRNERITQLSRQLAHENGASTWFEATGATIVEWLTARAWRILIGLLLIWIGLRVALKLVQRVADEWIRRAAGDPDDPSDDDQRALTLATVFSGIARIALYTIAGLLALDGIGVDTGPLLGSVAILGLAVSFGSQNLVRDVVNGFFILVEDQFAVGDFVEISGKSGTVERITIRSTWIRQGTGDLHAVPNGSISTVTNMTRDWSRARVEVGVAYDADLALVQRICGEIGEALVADEAWAHKLLGPLEFDGVTALGDSAVNVRVSLKTRPGEHWGTNRELNRRIKLAFDEAGIEIPFPQRVNWNKTDA